MPEYAQKGKAAQISSKSGAVQRKPAESAPNSSFSVLESGSEKEHAPTLQLSDHHAGTLADEHHFLDFSMIPVVDRGCKTMLQSSETSNCPIQAKLIVNQPGDRYEQEADRIAERIIATPAYAALNRVPTRVQRFAGQPSGQMNAAPESVSKVLASPGKPLQPALRQEMEPRFGYDFSRVRVHCDADAEKSAREVNAHAYTVGKDIVFGAGCFTPETHEGRRLIAHELTHVLQQSPSNGTAIRGADERHSVPLNAATIVSNVSLRIQRDDATSTISVLNNEWVNLKMAFAAATTPTEKQAAVTKILAFADKVSGLLAIAKGSNAPQGTPAIEEVRELLTQIGSMLSSNNLLKDALEVAKKSSDPEVQQKIILNAEPVPGASVESEQEFLRAIVSYVSPNAPLPAKGANEKNNQWLQSRTELIGRSLGRLSDAGLKDKNGVPLGLHLSSRLMENLFGASQTDVHPAAGGNIGGLEIDNEGRLLADCDVEARYGMRLLVAEGWTPVGYIVILPADRDAHAAALARKGAAPPYEYVGVSSGNFKPLGSFDNDAAALVSLRTFALEVYGSGTFAYSAYYQASANGEYPSQLMDPKNNKLTPLYQTPLAP
ncbi:MAG TPA: DUF4157 domain-containing protein [Methanothrix sp.]|nr:DUF4157 domain-containing protein [Methanothrix sp.]